VPTKRAPLDRRRTPVLSAEILELYRRGLELKNRRGERAHAEFIQVAKRLDWVLLQRGPHMVSVFDDLSGPEPGYMASKSNRRIPTSAAGRAGASCSDNCARPQV
jgi:hypothetical protein